MFGDAVRWILGLLLPLAMVGCQAQRPDVSAEVARLTGLDNAIVFREFADPLDAPPPENGDLTSSQAIRLALAHDPRIQASLARVRVAEADANQTRLLPNPIISVDIRFPTQSGSNTAYEATLTGDLIALLQKPGQIAAADKRLRGSACDALTTVLDVVSEVDQVYSAARSIDEQIANANRRGENLRRLRDLAKNRLEAGEAVRLDVLTLDAQIMQSDLDLSDLQLTRTEQRLNLARLIGQPRSDASWRLTPWETPPAMNSWAESAWIDAALLNRPEIRARTWELQALGDDLKAAELAPLQGGDVGAHAEHDPEWRVGPTLTSPLPIFDFGQAARAKIQAQRIGARHELARQQVEVIQDVRLAYATYVQSSRSLADAQGKLLPLQQQQLQQAQLAYQGGDADLATLLLAETDYELTLSKIVDLREKVTVAWVKLQRAAGGAGVAMRVQAVATPRVPLQAASQPATSQPSTTQPATGLLQ